MKTKKEQLLFILILTVSIMAILIASKQIYNIISHDVILDNNINEIEGDSQNEKEEYRDIFTLNLQFYTKNLSAEEDSTDPSDYTSVIDDNSLLPTKDNIIYYGDTSNNPQEYAYYKAEIDLPSNISLNDNTSCYSTISGRALNNFLDADGIMRVRSYEYSVRRQSSVNTSVNPFNVYESVEEFENKFFELNESNGILGLKYKGNGHNIDKCANGIVFNSSNETSYPNTATVLIICSKYSYYSDLLDSNTFLPVFNCNIVISNQYYPIDTIHRTYGDANTNGIIYSIDSNDFLQDSNNLFSEFNDNFDPFYKISKYILHDWKEGKETATLQCSIGEYYDEDGNLAISTQNNDLPMLFNIRDEVIPYIPVAGGGTEPISIQKDGSPKKFVVTQVIPYFDGAFWQEIQLQELTTKNKIQTVNFTSGTDGNIFTGYAAPDQTITVTEGKIINVAIYYGGYISLFSPKPTVTINSTDNSFTISNVYLTLPNRTIQITAEIIYEV